SRSDMEGAGAVALSAAKGFPSPTAPVSAWREAIARFAAAGNVVALQAVVEGLPIKDRRERARILDVACPALGKLGAPARRCFDDLLQSPLRDVRLAAINAFVFAFPDERGPALAAWSSDPDPLIRAKAKALTAALR